MRDFGWAYMMCMISLEGCDPIRPIIQQCHDQDKQGVAHFVRGNRTSVCGKARYITSFIGINGDNICTNTPEEQSKFALICPECLIGWKKIVENQDE